MKRNILHILWAAAVIPLALASCRQEVVPGETDGSDAQRTEAMPLKRQTVAVPQKTVTPQRLLPVTDAGFTSCGAPR